MLILDIYNFIYNIYNYIYVKWNYRNSVQKMNLSNPIRRDLNPA